MLRVIFEHNDGYISTVENLESFEEAKTAIENEAICVSENTNLEDVGNVFPMRWDIEGEVPAGQKSYGYVDENGNFV